MSSLCERTTTHRSNCSVARMKVTRNASYFPKSAPSTKDERLENVPFRIRLVRRIEDSGVSAKSADFYPNMPVAKARWIPRTSVPFFSVLLIGVLVPETHTLSSVSRSNVPAVSTEKRVIALYGIDR